MRRIKRIAAVCIAVCMILGLSVTAFAAAGNPITTGDLTVTGEQLAGKTVTAVRMFTATVKEGSTQNEYIFDSYTLESAWEGFFAGKITEDTEAAQYVQDLSGKDLENFANKALAWYGTNSSSNNFTSLTKTVIATQDGDTTKGTAVFNGLYVGYYLVFVESGPAMLINIPTNKTWEIKNTFPTVDKKVDTGDGQPADNGSAQIGDTVTFSLTSAVPDMTGYQKYRFNFVDTLSEGLTFVPNYVEVKIGGHTLATPTDYTVTEPSSGEQSNILKVTISDLIQVVNRLNQENNYQQVQTGDPIVVTYKAIINQKAVNINPVTNEAKVQYSNDPSTEELGESTPDTSKVYTYAINVHKWSVGNGGNTAYLAGAKFVLSKNETLQGTYPNYTNAISLVKETDNSYRLAITEDEDGTTTKEFTTNETGAIHIEGLESGIYYLHEISAPEGYNELKAPVKIEITLQDGDYTKPIYVIDGKANTDQNNTVKVENKKGIEFPETGGIGTIGLTVLGVGVILLGVLAPRKKKKDQTPQE